MTTSHPLGKTGFVLWQGWLEAVGLLHATFSPRMQALHLFANTACPFCSSLSLLSDRAYLDRRGLLKLWFVGRIIPLLGPPDPECAAQNTGNSCILSCWWLSAGSNRRFGSGYPVMRGPLLHSHSGSHARSARCTQDPNCMEGWEVGTIKLKSSAGMLLARTDQDRITRVEMIFWWCVGARLQDRSISFNENTG